jgi:hypothetical protein
MNALGAFAQTEEEYDQSHAVQGFGASPDGLGHGGFGAYARLGEEPAALAPNPMRSTLVAIYGLASLAGTAVGAYHGYKRNNSVGWAVGWALLGGLFPIVVVPVAFAQGLGERKRGG